MTKAKNDTICTCFMKILSIFNWIIYENNTSFLFQHFTAIDLNIDIIILVKIASTNDSETYQCVMYTLSLYH